MVRIGITNQRETLCVFDRKTSRPLRRAIVWQCKRSTDICEQMQKDGLQDMFKQKTGLVLDPYFSGTKLTWLLDHEDATAKALRDGSACVGTIDTYLIHRLSAGESFVTEASNASRTLAYNIVTGAWDEELCRALRFPSMDILPEVRDSAGDLGRTRGVSFLPDGVPISGALGDQQAALAGQTCFALGEAKCTYGTGAFLLANIGESVKYSDHGLLTTVGWQLGGKRTYAFEGAAFIAGAAVQFLRDQWQLVSSAPETEKLAQNESAAPEVYFVPALSGLGAPHWDPRAQGAILGLTRGTTKGQLVRACLEGIAFEVADLIAAMGGDGGSKLSVIRVDGGAAANNVLMQSQADFTGLPVDRPNNLETTAFGAALFSGLGVGLYAGLNELKQARSTEQVFEPTANSASRVAEQLAGWQRSISAVRTFAGTA